MNLNSIHQKMAIIAISNGKTAKDFHMSSLNNANTALFFAIAGGIILYFFAWKWALIPFALAIYNFVISVSATIVAEKVEDMFGPNRKNER